MNRTRYVELTTNCDLDLTLEENKAGWVFCCEWDGLLIHKDDPEAECCTCLKLTDTGTEPRSTVTNE